MAACVVVVFCKRELEPEGQSQSSPRLAPLPVTRTSVVESRGGTEVPPQSRLPTILRHLSVSGDVQTSFLLLAPAAVVLVVTNVYPTLNALWLSFFAYDVSIPNATPVFVGLQNY